MSRWSKRTEEEKEEILRKQRELRDKSKKYQSKDNRAVEIYKNNEIPILCPKCLRYSSCDNYEIVNKDFRPLGIKKVIVIKGICRKCKRPIERIIPPAFSEEGLLFAAVCINLKRDGRLKDLRKK